MQSATPSRIPRVRAFMTGIKQENRGQLSEFYNLRVSWVEPFYWNDDDINAENRGYNLNCFFENENKRISNLVLIPVKYDFTGYSEKYQFPSEYDLFVQCVVQAKNAKNFLGDWSYSTRIRVQEVPIYLAGLEGMNVRGFSEQDIERLKANIASAAATEVHG